MTPCDREPRRRVWLAQALQDPGRSGQPPDVHPPLQELATGGLGSQLMVPLSKGCHAMPTLPVMVHIRTRVQQGYPTAWQGTGMGPQWGP